MKDFEWHLHRLKRFEFWYAYFLKKNPKFNLICIEFVAKAREKGLR